MDEVKQWRETQLQDIQAFFEEMEQWQTQLKKDAHEWKNVMLRETNSLKDLFAKEVEKDFRASVQGWLKEVTQEMSDNQQAIQIEIDAMKGDVIDGDSRTIGESSGTQNLLGPTDGASDQAEADNTAGPKGRRRASGTK